MSIPVPTPHAICPLTLFDDMYAKSAVVMGWVVEGTLDLELIASALNRLVVRWPLLAGRLEHVPTNEKAAFQIRAPLNVEFLPPNYAPYVLTSSTSSLPITSYIPLPLPTISSSPPRSLFLHPSTPSGSAAWAKSQHPLTCWHVTHFPHAGEEHTCIGVAFSHGLLDGMGISFVVHALEAELLGCEWDSPPPLVEGVSENLLQRALDTDDHSPVDDRKDPERVGTVYQGVSPASVFATIGFLLWNLWQQWWHGAEGRMVLLPPKAYTALVARTRKEMDEDGKHDVRLSTGDILTAWFFKTIYTEGTSSNKVVHCSSMASLRSVLSPGLLTRYPHNCFLPIPYPAITVAELRSTPLHALAHSFTTARASLSPAHSDSLNRTLLAAQKDPHVLVVMPFNLQVDETLATSNMSIARIVDIKWTGTGGGKTVCRWKYMLADHPVLMSNTLTVSGRTRDGCTVLDVVLSKRRRERLENAVRELIDSAERH